MNHWHEDAIFYSLYPLGAAGCPHENTYSPPDGQGIHRLTDWVEHIASLGCNAVYFAPVFESHTHGYDTTDYYRIDSRLGTNEQFAALVGRCHDMGLRVVVDGVFNHTGRHHFAFRDLQQNRENSPYRDWYRGVHFGGNTPMNDGFAYEAWRGHFELPRLNPHCDAVREHLFGAVRLWIHELGIDGIRLDCADQLDQGFMRELRRICLAEHPDFWLMGEVIHGDYTLWANPGMLHAVTNYECSKGLWSSHNDGNMHEIAWSLGRQFGDGGIYRQLLLYNFADNHDLNRLADTVSWPEFLPTIYTILFAMPGLPSIYYGSEWGIHGITDRRDDWNLRPEIDIRHAVIDSPLLMAHIRALAGARAGCRALRHGSYRQISVTSHQLAFARECDGQTAYVLVNIADRPIDINVPVMESTLTDLLSGEHFAVQGGHVAVPVSAFGSRILTTGSANPPADTPPPAEVTVREILAQDWPQVREIFQQGIDTHLATFRAETPTWEEFCAGHCGPQLVAEVQGKIAGWAALSPAFDRGFYHGVVENSIYVRDSYAGMGVGKVLLKALLCAADTAGYWTVEARIIKENTASLALHRACGFRDVGTRERLGRMPQTGQWHDVVFLEIRSSCNGLD